MKLSVSNLCFLAMYTPRMAALPKEMGIEIFVEYGTDFAWDAVLGEVMDGRTGGLSVHSPFCGIDLGGEWESEGPVMEYYRWCFQLCARHRAEFCVLHPNGVYQGDDSGRAAARKRAVERMMRLQEMAEEMEVRLLIENMGYADHRQVLFDYDDFVEIFRQIPGAGCLIDTGHMVLAHWDMERLLADLGHKIEAYHIHDNHGTYDDHIPAGKGVLDWRKFAVLYHRHTPDARLVLEYGVGTVEEIIESAGWLRKLLEQAKG